jgi:hypothetical protein
VSPCSKGIVDAAEEAAKSANETRVESVKERGRITADLRANRKTGNRDKGEFWQGDCNDKHSTDVIESTTYSSSPPACQYERLP